jgi:hypothetical protein
MQKPEVGEIYMIDVKSGFTSYNIIEILRIEGDLAFYRTLFCSSNDEFRSPWNFVKYPDGVDRKLSSLEIELL